MPAITGAELHPRRDRPIASIGRRDVIDLLERYEDRPYIGNRVPAAVRKLFNWSVSLGIVETIPLFKGLAAPDRWRDRPLTDTEIKAIWNAAGGYPFGSVVRLLLPTAQRRSEVAGMKWSELNGPDTPTLRTIPTDRAKSGMRHDVPLSPQAAALIADAGTEQPGLTVAPR